MKKRGKATFQQCGKLHCSFPRGYERKIKLKKHLSLEFFPFFNPQNNSPQNNEDFPIAWNNILPNLI